MKIKTAILLVIIGLAAIATTYLGILDGTGMAVGIVLIGIAILGLFAKALSTVVKIAILAVLLFFAYRYLR